MGRHAGFDDLVGGVPAGRSSSGGRSGRRSGRRRFGWFRWLLVLTVVATVAAGAVALAGPDRLRRLVDDMPIANQAACSSTVVRIVAAPSAAATVTRMLGPLAGPADSSADGSSTGSGDCVRAVVEPQDPAETVAGAGVLPLDRAPDLWIPDSGLWAARVPRWPTRPVGTLGSTPLVLATSRTVVDARDWTRSAPSWLEAFSSGQPLAVPSPADHAESLVTLASLWQSLGKGKAADQALISTELIAARTAGLDQAQALELAQVNSAKAPLVPTTEQSVFAVNRAISGSSLTAVYPADGSPALEFPVLRVSLPPGQGATPSDARRSAVDQVVSRLASAPALSLAAADGFRQSGASGPKGVGVSAGPVKVLDPPDGAVLRDVLGRLAALAKPSRLLALIDVSLSMTAQLPDGTTRIELAGAAAAQGVELLPDQASVGVWVFSGGLASGKDFDVLAEPDPLGIPTADGGSRREAVQKAVASIGERLSAGGTPLYDTVLAGVRSLREDYDPRSVNSVVVFTDGANQNSRGITLTKLLRTLQDEADPARPVAVFPIGIGPETDGDALKQIAEATGGHSYQVDSPAEIRAALLDGLSTRKPVEPTG